MKAFSIHGAGSSGGLHVEECKLIHFISLYIVQVQVDQGHPHKIRYTESGKKGEEPQAHEYRGKFSEQNTNGSGSKIDN